MEPPEKTLKTDWGWTPLNRQCKHGAGDDTDMSTICHPAFFPEQHCSRHRGRRETESNWQRSAGRLDKEVQVDFQERSKEQRMDPWKSLLKQQQAELGGS